MEQKKLSETEVIQLIEVSKGAVSEVLDNTDVLFQGYCYYFALTLVNILDGAILCKNQAEDHYFIMYDNKYYDARVFFDVQNKRCSIPTKITDNKVLIEDLDGNFTVPIYISKKDYLKEYYNAGQIGGVRSEYKDAIWHKIYPVMYDIGIETVNSFGQKKGL